MASSSLDDRGPEKTFAENARTWWSAKTGDAGEWLRVDLGREQAVAVVQIDFADEGSTALGISQAPYRYLLDGSSNGKHWRPLADDKKNGRPNPHQYRELAAAASVRYVRITNVQMPNGASFR